jgi:hypothetical protein
MHLALKVSVALAVMAPVGCGGGYRVEVMGASDNPQRQAPRPHTHYDSTILLPSDQSAGEPSQPFAGTPQEKSVVHIRTGSQSCSGVLVGPRLVATAHQCVASGQTGVIPADPKMEIDIASTSLTWTTRHGSFVVAPACAWEKLDLAVIVLGDSVDWMPPAKVGTAPGAGAHVQALGFGRCAGQARGIADKVGLVKSIDSDALVIAVGLCLGDVGGPVVSSAGGDLIGVVSHQDDPDNVAHPTTTIFRLDTTSARSLFAAAAAVAGGNDPAKAPSVACE